MPPATTLALVEVLAGTGLPPGVLNAVVGSGATVGDRIVRAPELAAVSFTGSTTTGTAVHDSVVARGAKCQCEMGGKNPLVILADAPPRSLLPSWPSKGRSAPAVRSALPRAG